VILEAITKAGYKPGEQIGIALDPAASEFYDAATRRSTSSRSPTRASALRKQMVEFWAGWVRSIPSFRLKTAWPKTIGMAGS
jgi:enolase